MSAPQEIRAQLQSLRITQEQRPAALAMAGRLGRRLRWVGIVIGGAALIAVAVLLLRSGVGQGLIAGAAADVSLMTVVERKADEPVVVLTATGKIVSDHRVQVSTKVSGQIVELRFEQGDRVARGQVLARIEDVNYRALRDQAQAMLEKSRATRAFEEVNFARIERLHKIGQAPDIEFVNARRSLDEARAQVAANEAALDYGEKALRDTQIVAPISGVILERNVEVGDFVAAEGGRGAMANSQFAAIADMSTLRVEIDVSELDIAKLHKDMRCRVTPDAYKDRRYHGHVLWLDPGANYSKATVQVKVRIDKPDDFLRVEGSAQVTFLAGSDDGGSMAGGIWIPKSACRCDANGKSGKVFVLADGRLRETGVRIAAELNGQLRIASGLSAGQQIASEGIEKLADGQKVKPAS